MNAAIAHQKADSFSRQRSIHWRDRINELGSDSLSWLIVAPVWTDALAASSSFPCGSLPLDNLLDECESMGWCERRHTQTSHRTPSESAVLLANAATGILRMRPTEATAKIVGKVLDRLETFPQEPSVVEVSAKLRRDAAQAGVTGFDAPTPPDQAGSTPMTSVADDIVGSESDATAAHVWSEPLGALVERDVDSLPREQLADLVKQCIRVDDPRESARLLVRVAPHLPSDILQASIATLVPRLPETGGPAAQKALGNLATASAAGGALTYAFNLVERIPSGRLRARTLAAMAEAVATTDIASSGTSKTGLSAVLDRLLRALRDSTGVDLPVAADAAERLASAGANRPVLELAETALESHPRRGSEVPALVRLAGAAGIVSAPSATHFADAALEAAKAEGDPAVRSAALVLILSVVSPSERASIAEEALTAARAVIDDGERAQALALVAPNLPDPSRSEVFHDLIGLCAPDASRYAFWVPDATRPDLLATLARYPSAPSLRLVAATAGAAILNASGEGISVPPRTRRWAKLAARLDEDDVWGAAAGDELIAHVMPLLKSGATAEALGWVESARQLLDVVQGSFETSLVLAQRRIEVEQRKEYDRRELRRFLRRSEQIDAFTDLMNSPDDAWALHFLGHGGVGKSSLLRYLTETKVARDKGLLVARIDFDRLSPEYPQSKPGHLLVELLEELEAHADSSVHTLYFEAREKLRHLEWWVEGRDTRDEIERATERFCMFVAALGRPVVLVLDTCEELAKFQPAGAGLPQLEAAFDLMEAIHNKVPNTRLVLAGRRPLAVTGAGDWVIESPGSDSLPRHKDYLRIHEIKGFSRDEAIAYLTIIEDLTLDDEKLNRVLARCVDPHRKSYLNDSEPPGARYNPFDLALYAAALRGSSGDVDSLPTSDVYVEGRVRRRLGERWRALLPVVVMLRRFDQAMLAAALPNEDAEAAWRELRSTEWVAATFDKTSHAFFLEIDAGLLERLDAYFKQPEHVSQLAEARRTIAPGLGALVTHTPALRELSPDAVEAALRALSPDVGALLVDDLSLRVAREGAWSWARGVFTRVLGSENVLGDIGHRAAPAARALVATAMGHTPGHAPNTDQWVDVAAQAKQHPDRDVAQWLQVRADLLGQHGDPAAVVDAFALAMRLLGHRRRHALWLLGTCLAVIEHDPSVYSCTTLIDMADRLEINKLPTVASMILALTGRRNEIERALRIVGRTSFLDPADAAFLAADWAPPKQIRDRVRLNALHAGMNPDNWLTDALDADLKVDVDADRLAGQLLIRELNRRVLRPDEFLPAMARVGEHPPPIDTVDVHRISTPLRVAISRAWLGLGESSRAQRALGRAGRFARDTASQRILEIARVDIARRLRLDDVARLKRADLLNLTPSEVPRVIEAVGLLDGGSPQPSASDQPDNVHVLWRAAPRRICTGFKEPFHRWPNVRSALAQCQPNASAIEVGLALDAIESSLLSDEELPPLQQLPGAEFVHAWATAHPDQPEHAVRLLLRAVAMLESQPYGPLDLEADPLFTTVGPRRLAELALEEGELLALRLPIRGVRLLNASARRFTEIEDSVGADIAEAAASLAEVRARTTTAADRVGRIYVRLRDVVESADADQETARPTWDGWLVRLREVTDRSGNAPLRREAPSPELPDWTPPALQPAPPKAEFSLRVQAKDLGRAGVERTRRLRYGGAPSSAGSASSPPFAYPAPFERAEPFGSATPSAESGRPVDPGIDTQGALGSDALAAEPARPEPAAQARRRLRDAMLSLAGLSVGAVVGFVVGIAAYLLYDWLEAAISDTWLGRHPALQVVLYITLLLIGTYVVIRMLASGPTRNRLSVTLSEGKSEYDMYANGYRRRRWPLPDKRASARLRVRIEPDAAIRHVQPPVDSPEFESYVMPGRPTGPGVLSVALGRLGDAKHPLHVGLHTPPQLLDLPWDAFLTDLLRGIGPFDIARNRLREGYRARALRMRLGDRVIVATPRKWRELVVSAVPSRSSPAVLDPASARLSPGDIAVILALPVDTPVGQRLAIPPSREEDTARDLILEPDALAPAGTFMVVAGCPASDNDSASDVNMRDLRRCGADLIEAGVEVVVVLPSLPADMLHQCLHVLLTEMRRSTSMRETRGCAELVRRQLAIARPSDAREITELRAWL